MGLFGSATYSGGYWSEGAPVSEPWLTIEIHDSDVADVQFRPSASGRGKLYLGFEPRHYFDDPEASDPVDGFVEAAALAEWARFTTLREVEPTAVLALMAADDPEATPAADFVEDTAVVLFELIGLPLPPLLFDDAASDDDGPAHDLRRN